jgi:hypothetical protein
VNAKTWEPDITHEGEVTELVLLARQHYAVEGGVVRIRREDGVASWLARGIRADELVSFSAGRVAADVYPVRVKLYAWGVLKVDRVVFDGKVFRLPRIGPARELELDVYPAEGGVVDEVALATSVGKLG